MKTAAEHAKLASELLEESENVVGQRSQGPPLWKVQLAQAHALAALAIEFGYPSNVIGEGRRPRLSEVKDD